MGVVAPHVSSTTELPTLASLSQESITSISASEAPTSVVGSTNQPTAQGTSPQGSSGILTQNSIQGTTLQSVTVPKDLPSTSQSASSHIPINSNNAAYLKFNWIFVFLIGAFFL
jgi:hypothetical protein